ncbi:MAG TPA: DUF2007 domain-containing protein [Roseiflexaceae bacterium]
MTERALRWIGGASHAGQAHADDTGAQATTGGGRGEGVGPVCIGVVEGPLRAEIARTYLEQAGIMAYLQGEPIANVYGFAKGPLGMVRIFVPAAQAEEAARIFAELDFSEE